MKNKEIIGIAGFIGSGKTTAGNFLKKLGADYIEADRVVDELYVPGSEGWKKIVSFLGEQFLKKDGTINRRKLAKFVFGDAHKVKIINSLIHPLVSNLMRKKIDKSKAKVIVIEAAYFEKKNLLDIVDKVVWLDCAMKTCKRRIMKTAKFDGKMFERIYGMQIKPQKIDVVINNDGTKTNLYRQLKMLYYSLYE
jgi:dephospho-CoA kinase